MIKFCLVCEEEHDFNTDFDEDCNRCSNCGSLPYSKVDDITLGHRQKYQQRAEV